MKQKHLTVIVAILLIVGLLIPGLAVKAALAPPTIEFPANGATDVPIDTWVSWSDPNFIFNPTFHLQVSRNSNLTDLLVDVNLDGNTGYALRGLPKNTTFYWRVNVSSGGQTSDWSPVWTFTTTNRDIVTSPTLVSPPNGSTGLPDEVTLTWNAVEGADLYDVTINPGPIMYSSVEGTSLTVDFGAFRDLFGYTSFTWNVRSRTPAGLSEPSETWSLSIG
jgi:hypothetical protein